MPIPQPKNEKEAWECFVNAFVYFLRKKPLKTAIVVTLFFGAPGIVTYNYFTTDRVTIDRLYLRKR